MVVFYDGVCVGIHLRTRLRPAIHRHRGLYIEQAVGIRYADVDLASRYQRLGPFHAGCIQRGKHFQPPGGFSADGSESCRYGQADHPGAGNADPHSVFEDIAADLDADTEIRLQAPAFRTDARAVVGDDFNGLGDGQGDCYGLGAAKRRLYFAVNDVDYLFATVLH